MSPYSLSRNLVEVPRNLWVELLPWHLGAGSLQDPMRHPLALALTQMTDSPWAVVPDQKGRLKAHPVLAVHPELHLGPPHHLPAAAVRKAGNQDWQKARPSHFLFRNPAGWNRNRRFC